MSDVETLLTRSMTDAVAGVELDPELIARARDGIVGRRRRRRLQAGATVALLIAALVAGAIVLANRSSSPRGVQIGHDGAAQSVQITVINKRGLFRPRVATVTAGKPFRLTIHNEVYTLDGHKPVTINQLVILPRRYFTPPSPGGIRSLDTTHAVFQGPREIPAGTTTTNTVPALPAGRYLILTVGPLAWTTLIVEPENTVASNGVTVPTRATHTDIIGAYNLLHRLGFRVELPQQMSISSLDVPGVTLNPAPGTVVPRGSIIQITPGPAAIGSPATEKSNPHYLVPNFDGQPLSDAIRWADQHHMFWAIPKLPPLSASTAPRLFDAYRIVGQHPGPHQRIVQGITTSRGFKPTPLTLTVVPEPAQ